MNLMEHEVMSAPIGAEAAGEQKQTVEKARTKIIDAAPLMERLRAAIAFGNEKGMPTDELEQVLEDIEGMEELPPAQPEIIDGRLFVTVDDIKKVGCVLVDEHKSNFCRQFWMDGDGPEPCEDAVSRAFMCELGATCIAKPDGNGDLIALGRIDMLPPVTPKQRTGKWIDDGSELGCQCSECGKSLDEYIHATECMTLIEIPKFCPNCGVKMEGDVS